MPSRPSFTLKQGEAKTIQFTVKDKTTHEAIDLTGSTLTFGAKKKVNPSGLDISKSNSDFTRTDEENGIVGLPLDDTDTDIDAVEYTCELKVEFSASNIDKSVDMDLKIDEAVITA